MSDELKSINDQLFLESTKSLPPFPSYGSGWGTSQMFQSEQAWDSWIDTQIGLNSANNIEKYRALVGDLSQNSLMCAAIRFLGDSIAPVKLQVKQMSDEDGDGQKGESKPIPKHPLPLLWKKPNKYYSGSTMSRGIAFSLVLSSNAYILKNYNDAETEVLELWWEPHWTIRPVWPIDGSEFIAYYEVNRAGMWYPIDLKNVIHIRQGLHPYNQRLGFSGNDSILPELYGDQQAAQYYATLMGGSGVPGFMVSIDKDMKVDQTKVDALEKQIVRKTTGDKKGQPLVLKGAKAYKLAFNPKEIDLRSSRFSAEDRFCAVQGIPAVVLELGSGMAHSIYKNVAEAQKRAWTNYVIPKLQMIEEELNTHLLPDFIKTKDTLQLKATKVVDKQVAAKDSPAPIDDQRDTELFCEYDLTKVEALQEDIDTKAKRLEALYISGAIMRSEVRSGLNYGPSDPANPDADKVWGMTSATETDAANKEQQAQQAQAMQDAMKQSAGVPNAMQLGPQRPKPGFLLQKKPGLPSKKPLLGLAKAMMGPIFYSPEAEQLLLPPATDENGNDNELTWEQFGPHTGSLGIPRTSMPQVQSAHRGAMVNFLNARGIEHDSEQTVNPGDLKPSQLDYSPQKVQKAKDYVGTERPLLVSSDGYVADGHHQWLAKYDQNVDQIPVIKLHAPILQLLLEMSQFPSSYTTTKAMPDDSKFVSSQDVQATIRFLKQHRFAAAAAMMTAKPINKNGGKKNV